jgi:HAD superfamily hydrolase (TIGR01509 family)
VTDARGLGADGRPAAVLWDMDGTLVDTEPYWFEAEFELAAAYGFPWSEAQALAMVGNPLPVSAAGMIEEFGLAVTPELIVDQLLDAVVERIERVVPFRPGALELLTELAEHEIPCGLVTMSYRRFVAPVLSALPEGTFVTVVTGETVEQGKPHPEAYLTAAANLGVRPEDCVAIEDSDPGAASAAAAGCAVLVVPHHVAVPPGPSRSFATTLSEVDVQGLRALMS